MTIADLEQALTAGDFARARQEADRLLQEGGLGRKELGRVYWGACRAALQQQDAFAAVRAGERGLEVAPAGERETRARPSFDLGRSLARIGDAGRAEQHLSSFLELLPKVPALAAWEGPARAELAGIYLMRRQWQKAVDLLGAAAGLLRKSGEPGERVRCALDLAWCHLRLQQPEAAGPDLAEAERLLGEYPQAGSAAEALVTRALWERARGNHQLSAELCGQVLAPGRPDAGPQHRSLAAWIAGENLLDDGLATEAAVHARLAQEYAARASQPSLINLATDLLRRCQQA